MKHTILALTALFGLTACGTQWTDRAVSGGMIGTGGGLVAGALIGAPVAGAMAGLALGGVAGGLTKPDYVYLGEPFWYDKGYYNGASSPNPNADYVRHPLYKSDNAASVRTRQAAEVASAARMQTAAAYAPAPAATAPAASRPVYYSYPYAYYPTTTAAQPTPQAIAVTSPNAGGGVNVPQPAPMQAPLHPAIVNR